MLRLQVGTTEHNNDAGTHRGGHKSVAQAMDEAVATGKAKEVHHQN